MRTYPYTLITNGNMAANSATSGSFASTGQKIDYTIGYAVEATYTGTNPQGIMSLEASNNGVNFVTIDGSEITLSDGSTGTTVWNVRFPNYDYLKFRFRATSASSGLMTATLYSKGG